MKIQLYAFNDPTLLHYFKRLVAECDVLDDLTLEVVDGDILDHEKDWDGLVSPANSFGFMDGGIDYLYSLQYGWEVQNRLQQLIRKHHSAGELLVGQCETVALKKSGHRKLFAAPTMRVPMRLPNDTIGPYLATKAAVWAFRSLRDGGWPGRILAFPGMGTGCGAFPANRAAAQMGQGIIDGWNDPEPPETWHAAAHKHNQIANAFLHAKAEG